MIAALARAAGQLGRPDWLQLAQGAFDAVIAGMGDGDALSHSRRGMRRLALAFPDDYAQMSRAAITLYQQTGNHRYLQRAVGWVDHCARQFRDPAGGAFFLGTDGLDGPIVRPKNALDGPSPSANGTLAEVSAMLWHLTGDPRHRDVAEEILTTFAGEAKVNPAAHATLYLAAGLLEDALQVVVIGDGTTPGSAELWASAVRRCASSWDPAAGGVGRHPATRAPRRRQAASWGSRRRLCLRWRGLRSSDHRARSPARATAATAFGCLREGSMAHRISAKRNGGPEVLEYEDYDVPAPGPGEALVRHAAIGLNYIDVYHRTGMYPGNLPLTPGMEGAGTVEAVGPGVGDLRPGQRVAYAAPPVGAYADIRVMPAKILVPIPNSISFETAAAMMLKGMTAQYLLRQTYAVKPGDTILFHAAAGGVGLIVGQWAKHLGATVIGTVSSPEKAALARAHGFDHVIDYKREDFVERVREITGGAGVPVVYDGVGKDTFMRSLDCLRPLGLGVSFGSSSGPVENFGLGRAQRQGVAVRHPPDGGDLYAHARAPARLRQRSDAGR